MNDLDELHATCVELSDQVADELRRLEPEKGILEMVERLRELLARLIAGQGSEPR